MEHLPQHLHLVIATREDPPLPLARLRARRQLVELHAADLRFTPEQAERFLREVMRLPISPRSLRRWRRIPRAGWPGCSSPRWR